MNNLPQFTRQDGPPLFPKALYNRPVTRHGAGRLLVPGGHSGDLSLPTALHQLALAAGAGHCQVALPDTLVRLVAGAPDTTFVPASPSGSLGREALGPLLQLAEDADALMLGASLSNSSQTSILIERLVHELNRPIIAFGDTLVAMQHHIEELTNRPDCLIVATMPEVFKLAGQLGVSITVRRGGGLINKLEIVRDLAAASRCHYAVYGTEIITAAGTDLVVTPTNYRLSLVPAAYYAVLGVTWLQNPSRRHDGLATGAYILREAAAGLGDTDRPSVGQLAKSIAAVLARESF
ncbi:MAG TPA: hypothetical protein VLI05_05050 [Candidatus Saccharimonadia bacterium]|nr:hypothetical protein [Candidatus Saccharimonadia bacterium]